VVIDNTREFIEKIDPDDFAKLECERERDREPNDWPRVVSERGVSVPRVPDVTPRHSQAAQRPPPDLARGGAGIYGTSTLGTRLPLSRFLAWFRSLGLGGFISATVVGWR
jgi:hypothetical protein